MRAAKEDSRRARVLRSRVKGNAGVRAVELLGWPRLGCAGAAVCRAQRPAAWVCRSARCKELCQQERCPRQRRSDCRRRGHRAHWRQRGARPGDKRAKIGSNDVSRRVFRASLAGLSEEFPLASCSNVAGPDPANDMKRRQELNLPIKDEHSASSGRCGCAVGRPRFQAPRLQAALRQQQFCWCTRLRGGACASRVDAASSSFGCGLLARLTFSLASAKHLARASRVPLPAAPRYQCASACSRASRHRRLPHGILVPACGGGNMEPPAGGDPHPPPDHHDRVNARQPRYLRSAETGLRTWWGSASRHGWACATSRIGCVVARLDCTVHAPGCRVQQQHARAAPVAEEIRAHVIACHTSPRSKQL